MNEAAPKRMRPSAGVRLLGWLLGLLLLGALLWCGWVYQGIAAAAAEDQAIPSDAIAVFGAAEYDGRPSPVFHARLDHAVDLYRKGMAPLIITLGGGSDKDSGKTEGGVGRDYLLARGIPLANIIAETTSSNTEQQVHRVAAIARDHGLRHLIAVSDATHMFRIRELCRASGLDVYTSPRLAVGHISRYDMAERYLHEILSYTAFRLDLPGGGVRSWLQGESETD